MTSGYPLDERVIHFIPTPRQPHLRGMLLSSAGKVVKLVE